MKQSSTNSSVRRHIPVLLKEIKEGLKLRRGGVYIDCNLGDGGHAEAVIEALGGDVTIIGFDIDPDAITRARAYITRAMYEKNIPFNAAKNLHLFRKNFRTLSEMLFESGLPTENYADNILFDLGLSSYELDESGRGFSFQKNEPLLMIFGAKEDHAFNAHDLVNGWKEEDIANVIFAYGEDRFARRIAKKIIEARVTGEIRTTGELAEIVKSAYPAFARHGKIHPATRTFQAIRIAVNDELRALQDTLPQALKALKSGGRLAVISFHSLEDRIVKTFFKRSAAGGEEEKTFAKIITKRPITASREEQIVNPRSRSAKLRIIEKA